LYVAGSKELDKTSFVVFPPVINLAPWKVFSSSVSPSLYRFPTRGKGVRLALNIGPDSELLTVLIKVFFSDSLALLHYKKRLLGENGITLLVDVKAGLVGSEQDRSRASIPLERVAAAAAAAAAAVPAVVGSGSVEGRSITSGPYSISITKQEINMCNDLSEIMCIRHRYTDPQI
jgi:hypothetical protein